MLLALAIVKNADKTSGGICNVSGMWGTCMDSTLSGSDSWLPEKMLTYICTVNQGVSLSFSLFGTASHLAVSYVGGWGVPHQCGSHLDFSSD